MYNYKLSNAAQEDLIRIYSYGVQTYGITQADKYFYGFFDCFERISKNPFLFTQVDYIKPGYRRCVYHVDSIYFKIENEVIEIMYIMGRQDFSS
jgi:toxin ParE1/3/4